MDLYKEYPAHIVFMRRTFAVVAGVLALPVMLFWKDRARFYSYLHRVWAKTSECFQSGKSSPTATLRES